MPAVETGSTQVRRPDQWPMSVAAYHALGELGLIQEKTELLYGRVYQKMPKSPLHRRLVQRLLQILRALQLPGHFVWQEQPLTLAESEPEPDVAVVAGREGDFDDRHPTTADLVIEVAVTSHDYDRSKLRAYARAEVKECWLVLVPERQIEVYRQPGVDGYAGPLRVSAGETLVSAAVPAIRIDTGALFA